MLTPVLHNCLACPSALAAVQSTGIVYVCEMFTNRVLKLTPKNNTYYATVFLQLAGSMGPSSIAVDNQGRIYVGMFDFAGMYD